MNVPAATAGLHCMVGLYPKCQQDPRYATKRLSQQTEQDTVQTDYNHSRLQRLWSIKDTVVSDKSKRLCREVRETETDLICEVSFMELLCSICGIDMSRQ